MKTEDIRGMILKRKDRSAEIARLNSFLYNGGVVLVLACTALATFASAVWTGDSYKWIAPLLTALATILVGVDRSLQLGARWIHYNQAKAKYDSALVRLATIEVLADEQRTEELIAIRAMVAGIPLEGASVPGTNGIEGG